VHGESRRKNEGCGRSGLQLVHGDIKKRVARGKALTSVPQQPGKWRGEKYFSLTKRVGGEKKKACTSGGGPPSSKGWGERREVTSKGKDGWGGRAVAEKGKLKKKRQGLRLTVQGIDGIS